LPLDKEKGKSRLSRGGLTGHEQSPTQFDISSSHDLYSLGRTGGENSNKQARSHRRTENETLVQNLGP
jgi:hypothetical protein